MCYKSESQNRRINTYIMYTYFSIHTHTHTQNRWNAFTMILHFIGTWCKCTLYIPACTICLYTYTDWVFITLFSFFRILVFLVFSFEPFYFYARQPLHNSTNRRSCTYIFIWICICQCVCVCVSVYVYVYVYGYAYLYIFSSLL